MLVLSSRSDRARGGPLARLSDVLGAAAASSVGAISTVRDRSSYIYLPGYAIAYGRVPKVANSAIKRMLATALGYRHTRDNPVNTDRFWRALDPSVATMLTAPAVLRLSPKPFVFAVVRNPFDRILSAYESKLLAPLDESRALGPGFRPGLDFGAFLERIARIPDRVANPHFRAQSAILCDRERTVPDIVLRLETIRTDWDRVRAPIAARGLTLPSWPAPHPRGPIGRLRDSAWTPERVALVRRRYATDFALFYPDVTDPV